MSGAPAGQPGRDSPVAGLSVTSIQAPNQDFIVEGIAGYLSQRLGVAVSFDPQLSWQVRERLLDAGRVQAGWICGLPYVRKADRSPSLVGLLAAPVMAAPRYRGQPVYFSDVVVRRDSPYTSFEDLRGVSWAYNEPNSQSGYNVTRYYLATLGERSGFFGQVLAAGSHEAALELVLSRRVAASAIDSTVLEIELRKKPAMAEQLRVITTLGPSPIPPWVVPAGLDPDLRETLRLALIEMHQRPAGREILAAGGIAHFVQVVDVQYDPIRAMARRARGVRLGRATSEIKAP